MLAMIRLQVLSSIIFFLFIQKSLVSAQGQCYYEPLKELGVCKKVPDCVGNSRRSNPFRERGVRMKPCSNLEKTICCPMSFLTQSVPKTLNETEKNDQERISARKCKEYSQKNYQIITRPSTIIGEGDEILKIDKCLRKSVSLIVNGEAARDGEFPHHVSIGYLEKRVVEYACGGSLLSEKFVLTAAHCLLTDHGPGFVKFGHLRSSNGEFRIKNTHINTDSSKVPNDIGLAELNRRVNIDERTIPICLPQTPNLPESAVVIGMGQTGYRTDLSNILLKTTVNRFSFEDCSERYLEKKKIITNGTMICYGHQNLTNDACNGDSGESLQVSNADEHCTYTIYGIVSNGPKRCGTPGFPGVYVNVYTFLDWIEEIVWS